MGCRYTACILSKAEAESRCQYFSSDRWLAVLPDEFPSQVIFDERHFAIGRRRVLRSAVDAQRTVRREVSTQATVGGLPDPSKRGAELR